MDWRRGNAYGQPGVDDVHSVTWLRPYQRLTVFRRDGRWHSAMSGRLTKAPTVLKSEKLDDAKAEAARWMAIEADRLKLRALEHDDI